VVDRLERLAGACLSDNNPPLLQFCQVERVQRLAVFHHHIVRDVDDVVDHGNADRPQPILQPGRTGFDLHAANHASDIARAKVGAFDDD
jgi:hypothetical protein